MCVKKVRRGWNCQNPFQTSPYFKRWLFKYLRYFCFIELLKKIKTILSSEALVYEVYELLNALILPENWDNSTFKFFKKLWMFHRRIGKLKTNSKGNTIKPLISIPFHLNHNMPVIASCPTFTIRRIIRGFRIEVWEWVN